MVDLWGPVPTKLVNLSFLEIKITIHVIFVFWFYINKFLTPWIINHETSARINHELHGISILKLYFGKPMDGWIYLMFILKFLFCLDGSNWVWTGFECRSGISKEISIHFEPGWYYDDTGMIPQCYKYHIELWISLISTPCVLKKAILAFNISFVGAVGHQKTWFLLLLKS